MQFSGKVEDMPVVVLRQGLVSCRRRQLEVLQIRSSPRCSRSEEGIFAAYCGIFRTPPSRT